MLHAPPGRPHRPQIDLLAKAKQSNRSAVVREAVIRYLEDNEDLELARQALAEHRWEVYRP